jgi:gliding motility-associated-like protein
VTINQPPQVFIGNDTIICKNMAIPLNPTITPVQTYTYNWSSSGVGYLSQNGIPNPTATMTSEGNFQLILQVDPTAQGCQGADTMNILVLPNDIILHNGDTTICNGATVPVQVTGHPLFTYEWIPSTYLNNAFIEDPISTPTGDVSYTVTATYPGCTPMIKSFDITVEPVPMVNAGPNRVMCDHDTIQLNADVFPPNFNGYIYTWNPAIGLSNSAIQDPVFLGGVVDQLYQVIVSTPIGCSDTDSIYVHVNSTEFATISPEHAIICTGDTVFYNAIGGVQYLWRPGYYLSDTTVMNPYATPHADIDYTIFSTSQEGCTDTDVVHIMVASQAVLNAGEDVTLYPGESTQLYADGNCSYFQWFPPNGLSSTNIKNPWAQPSVTTQYIVYGETEHGCKIQDTVTIRISPESILDLPDAFSPGSGTSMNDALTIKVRGEVTLKKFVIFNRWGNQVFSTTDIRQGWDGRYDGKPQPMGAYVYMIEAVTSTGLPIVKQGNVTLIR